MFHSGFVYCLLTAHNSLFTFLATKFHSWGSYKDGKLGIQTDRDHVEPIEMEFFRGKNVVRIAAGCDHSAVVTAEGDVYTWGFGQHGALGLDDLLDSPMPRKVTRFQGAAPIVDVQCGMDLTLVETL